MLHAYIEQQEGEGIDNNNKLRSNNDPCRAKIMKQIPSFGYKFTENRSISIIITMYICVEVGEKRARDFSDARILGAN